MKIFPNVFAFHVTSFHLFLILQVLPLLIILLQTLNEKRDFSSTVALRSFLLFIRHLSSSSWLHLIVTHIMSQNYVVLISLLKILLKTSLTHRIFFSIWFFFFEFSSPPLLKNNLTVLMHFLRQLLLI